MFLMSEISSEPPESAGNLGILFFPYFGFSAAQLCARTHIARGEREWVGDLNLTAILYSRILVTVRYVTKTDNYELLSSFIASIRYRVAEKVSANL